MADYKTMYYALFNAITEVVKELQEAQRQAEERYICCEEQMIIFHSQKRAKEDNADSIPSADARD